MLSDRSGVNIDSANMSLWYWLEENHPEILEKFEDEFYRSDE